jgi:(S)-ureidoglycine aminohydrolase
MELYGQTRSYLARDHALIEPGSFVTSPLPGWDKTQGVTLISPRMGARFKQYLALMEPGGVAGPTLAGIERHIYVLDGSVNVRLAGADERTLTAGGFVFTPAGETLSIRASVASRLNVFEKRFVARNGLSLPRRVIGREQDVEGVPFIGDPAARLHVLLPDEAAYDLAVNVFRFDPGATLPFVEVHVMEHGLIMLQGQGIYRLSDRWYPVRAGDVIWMAPYCPQWFVATGKEPAAYLYYKDVNRDSIEAVL